jgi:tetratricopeptide (TPR) repeat protein
VVLCKAKKFELVVDSWDRPLALARAWCVWEIYGAVSQQVPMTTLLLPGESQRFRADLSEGRIDEDQWKNVFASINVQHLASNLAEDAARILGQIRRVGVLQVNDAVMVPVKKWLLDSALDCASGLKTGHCYIGLAALHRVFGETQESQRWYEKVRAAAALQWKLRLRARRGGSHPAFLRPQAREAFEKERGPEDASTITSRAWLADVLLEQGKLGEAGPVLEQVLAARSKLHGPESAEAAAAMNNLGGLRRATGDLQGAADLFEKALAIGEKLHGDKSPYGNAIQAIVAPRAVCCGLTPRAQWPTR